MGYRNLGHSSLFPLKRHTGACHLWPFSSGDLCGGLAWTPDGRTQALFLCWLWFSGQPRPSWLFHTQNQPGTGEKAQALGSETQWEAQIYYWLSGEGVSKFSIHRVCMSYWKFQEGNKFFSELLPMGHVRSNRTATNGRFSIYLGATL